MRKEKKGKVISDKMMSTVIVETVSLTAHPVYGKIIKKRSKFAAHNPGNKAKEGNVVRIVETRPLSKTKRWRVVEILGSHGSASSEARAASSKRKKSAAKPKKAAKPRKTAKSGNKGKK